MIFVVSSLEKFLFTFPPCLKQVFPVFSDIFTVESVMWRATGPPSTRVKIRVLVFKQAATRWGGEHGQGSGFCREHWAWALIENYEALLTVRLGDLYLSSDWEMLLRFLVPLIILIFLKWDFGGVWIGLTNTLICIRPRMRFYLVSAIKAIVRARTDGNLWTRALVH